MVERVSPEAVIKSSHKRSVRGTGLAKNTRIGVPILEKNYRLGWRAASRSSILLARLLEPSRGASS